MQAYIISSNKIYCLTNGRMLTLISDDVFDEDDDDDDDGSSCFCLCYRVICL